MKYKKWNVMLANDSEHCSHTKFSCGDCGTYIFQRPIWTKSREKETLRVMRKISKAYQELEKQV